MVSHDQSPSAVPAVVFDFLNGPNCWDGQSDVLDIAPDLTYDQAYLAQFEAKRRDAGANGPIIGYQASLTSEEAKRWGPPDMPKPNIGTLQLRNWRDPSLPFSSAANCLVECEVAMRMGAPLKGMAVTAPEARKAVASLEAAFEVVQLKPGMAQRSGQHLIATHNAGSSIVLSGNRKSPDMDLVTEPVELIIDGARVAQSVAGGSGGDPFLVLAEIANTLGRYGLGLEAGMIVMTGSSIMPHPLPPGTRRVEGRFGRLGALDISFAQG